MNEDTKELLHFSLRGRIVPQSRPRATVLGGRVHLYELKDARDFKAYVRMTAQKASEEMGWKVTDGAVEVSISINLPLPASMKKWQKDAVNGAYGITKDVGRISKYALARRWCTHRPDVDNYAKSILDAITDSGVVWKDDAQIASLFVTKQYEPAIDEPLVIMQVRKSSDEPDEAVEALVKEYKQKEAK